MGNFVRSSTHTGHFTLEDVEVCRTETFYIKLTSFGEDELFFEQLVGIFAHGDLHGLGEGFHAGRQIDGGTQGQCFVTTAGRVDYDQPSVDSDPRPDPITVWACTENALNLEPRSNGARPIRW